MIATRAALLLWVSLIVGGCTMTHTPGVSYTFADGRKCESKPHFDQWCILEIPEFGYVAVMADRSPEDRTNVTIRLTPKVDVDARWASRELNVVNLDKTSSQPVDVLSTESVVKGIGESAHIQDYQRVGYVHSESRYSVKPSIKNVELRLPAVIAGGKVINVPPIRYHETLRIPVPVPNFLSSH